MHGMPVLCPTTTCSSLGIANNTNNLAVCSLGLDMVGPLQTAPCGFTHMLVAVDKFTKWIEAKPIRKLDGATALRFVRDLVVRFGLPHSIITDNGRNLSLGEVEAYC